MKDKFSLFIGESVDYIKQDYYKLMFQSKKLFFDYLLEDKKPELFEKEITKIWGDVDHRFMEQRMNELEDMIGEFNSKGHKIKNPNAKLKEVYEVKSALFYKNLENKYAKHLKKYYDTKVRVLEEGYVDKKTYLSQSILKYDIHESIIPYYNKDGSIRSYHNIADYNSMVYNTSLNHAGWNRTSYDSELLDNDLVYLPAHPFACHLCIEWQGKVYSESGNSKIYPPKQQAIDGGVGHPNCKHQWTIFWDEDQIQDDKFNSKEWEEKYVSKQKERSLQLKRDKFKLDMGIYQKIGNYDEADKIKNKISKLNAEIKNVRKDL